MELTELMNAVSTIGFPVFSWVLLAWYVYKQSEKQDSLYQTIIDKFQDLNSENLKVITEVTTALQELKDAIKGGEE